MHPTLAGRGGGRGEKTKQKKTPSWVSPTSQRPKIEGQITSRDLLSAAGPSLHRPQSFPSPPAAHGACKTDRCIMLCLCVCVRVGSRLQIHRRASQPRPSCPGLFPNLSAPSPSSLLLPSPSVGAAHSVACRLSARRQRAAGRVFFVCFFLPRRPRTELRAAAAVQSGLSPSLRRAQGWYCSCQTSVCLKLV